MSQKFDNIVTKNLRLIAGNTTPAKNGFYLKSDGSVGLAIAGVEVMSWFSGGAGGAIPPQGGVAQVGQLVGANMNVTTDQNIPIQLPPGFTRYRIEAIYVNNASISLTTAAGGVYPAAAKAGVPLVAAAQAYAGLTAPGENAAGSALALTLAAAAATTEFNAVQTALGLFFALTTAQGAAATADIYVFARVFR